MDVVHKNHSRFRRPKRELALDARSFQAWHTFFEQEPANFALVILGPDEEKVCDGGVGDPVFSAADPPAPVLLPPRPRLHGAWVRPVVWLREAEATHHPARCELWKIFVFLLVRAKREDGVHHKRGLDTHRRPVRAVDPLNMVGGEAVSVVRNARASISGYRRTQESQLPHLGHDCPVELPKAVRFHDARQQLLPRVRLGRGGNHGFFLGQLRIESERVGPVIRFRALKSSDAMADGAVCRTQATGGCHSPNKSHHKQRFRYQNSVLPKKEDKF
mmetsp:Transcript_10227/g.23640  ORF Transcript_10227/g.23640 Transcript_10227/m.23640 type:complete len:274 (-) Transcript_10227:35-856(-)